MASDTWNIKNFDELVQSRYSERQLYQDRHERTVQGFPRMSQNTKDEIAKLKEQGFSYSQIGAKVGTSKSAISGAVYRHKL